MIEVSVGFLRPRRYRALDLSGICALSGVKEFNQHLLERTWRATNRFTTPALILSCFRVAAESLITSLRVPQVAAAATAEEKTLKLRSCTFPAYCQRSTCDLFILLLLLQRFATHPFSAIINVPNDSLLRLLDR